MAGTSGAVNFDVQAVVKQMLAAAMGPLAQYGKAIQPVAKAEFTKIAQMVEQIGVDRMTQKITTQDAKDQLENMKDASASAMAMAAGLGTIAAEAAMNAAINVALGAVSGLVNGYLGMVVI